ncbi:MAG: DUF4265 domain-containing protein [Putridiphycobacter sp.]
MGIFDIFYKKQTKKPVNDSKAEQVKILFRFYSNLHEQEMVENLWAKVVDDKKGYYKLDNIPFYVSSVATGDIISAQFDNQEQSLTFNEVIQHSGNSTVHVILLNQTTGANTIRDIFVELGCNSEKLNDNYFALDIPVEANYTPVKQKLDKLSLDNTIDYAESCLSQQHRE